MESTWIICNNSLDKKDMLKNESIFNVSNGYIGVRGNFEEKYRADMPSIRGTYINAFYENVPYSYGEKAHGYPETNQRIVNVTDSQGIDLIIGGERFSLFTGTILDYKRYLNMKDGRYVREIHWRSKNGREVRIKITRVASLRYPELFVIGYEIEKVNFDDEIIIVSEIDGDVKNYTDSKDMRVSSGNADLLRVLSVNCRNGIMQITSQTHNSKLKVSASVKNKVDSDFNVEYEKSEKSASASYRIAPGKKSVEFTKYNVYTDSTHYPDPEKSGYEILNNVYNLNPSEILKSQKDYLSSFWNIADIKIERDDSIQQAVRYSLYQLLQSAGKDGLTSIPAKGLSGEGYDGHYFWDCEIYILPLFTLCCPELAKKLLTYRYSILDKARKRAIELGHKKGAAYAWRTINGDECSSYFPASTAQYHINGDIAYSCIQYYLATGDLGFIKECGAEIIFETARIWIQIGHYDDGLFKIDAVTGPDEYTALVNNNYYTNVIAKYNLKWAVKIYGLLRQKDETLLKKLCQRIGLTEDEISQFRDACEKMYLPYDKELRINAQDDSFLSKAVWDFEGTPKDKYPLLLNYHPLTIYRYQVLKQPDTVLAHFLCEDEADIETIKNSYDYYEKITTHDSSLSFAVYSIMASKLNYYDKAYDYFMKTVRLDLDDINGNTKDGIHTANMGGTYMAIVFGFAGLRIKEDYISLNPKLPSRWSDLKFGFRYRGADIAVDIEKGNTKINVKTSGPVNLKVNGRLYTVISDQVLDIKN